MKRCMSVVVALVLAVSVILTGCAPAVAKKGIDVIQKKKESKGFEDVFQDKYTPSGFVQADVDSETVQWFCSAYAIYTEMNHKDLGQVGGTSQEHKEDHHFAIVAGLDSGWGIAGRGTAISQMTKLYSEGHRGQYKEKVSEMKKEGMLEMSEEEAVNYAASHDIDVSEATVVYRAYQDMGENAMDGWDYCRLLQVLGDCYQADYISLEECLDASLIVAEKIQETFESWEELCKSYIYGYYFWKHDGVDAKWRWDIYEELADESNGPYSVPFHLNFAVNWKNISVKEQKETEEDDETETRAQTKSEYVMTDKDHKKEFTVHTPKGYLYDEELSGETFLSFENEVSEATKYPDLKSLFFSVETAESFSEADAAGEQKEYEEKWKGDSAYSGVEFTDITTIKAGKYNIKYTAVTAIQGTDKDECIKQWYAWLETADGYVAVCNGFEIIYDISKKEIEENAIKEIMLQIEE